MSLFRKKEEKIHFVRDEAGNVKSVEREYSGRGSKTPISDKLLSQAKKEKKSKKLEWKQQQKEAFDKSFKKARLERMAQKGRVAGKTTLADRFSNYNISNNYNPFGSMFDTGMNYSSKKPKSDSKKYTIVSGKAYPIAKTSSKKKKTKKKRSSSSGNYDMFDNWGYMK